MRRLILIVLLAAGLVACGGGDDDDDRDGDDTSSETTEASEDGGERSGGDAPAGQGAGGPVAIDEGASCSTVEDGGPAAELVSVDVEVDDDELVVTWTVGGAPNATEEVLYAITGFDLQGNNGAQLGATTDPGGESTGSFIYDIGDKATEDLGDTDGLDDDVIEARFPLDQIEGWGEGFRWYGAVSVDGDEVDGCPSLNGATKIDSLTGDTFTVG